MGYIGNKPKTEDTIDSGGWLHTGDIGKFDEVNYVHVDHRSRMFNVPLIYSYL